MHNFQWWNGPGHVCVAGQIGLATFARSLFAFFDGTNMRPLCNAQYAWLMACANELMTGSTVGSNPLRHSANRTMLKSWPGQFRVHRVSLRNPGHKNGIQQA